MGGSQHSCFGKDNLEATSLTDRMCLPLRDLERFENPHFLCCRTETWAQCTDWVFPNQGASGKSRSREGKSRARDRPQKRTPSHGHDGHLANWHQRTEAGIFTGKTKPCYSLS